MNLALMNFDAEIMYWVTLAVFLLSYFGLAWGGVPGLRIDRAGVAFVGAAAMLACGAISLDEAAAAIDSSTIALLLGMMVVVAHLQIAGFFVWVTDILSEHFSGPYTLLAMTVGLSGTLSAVLVNDVVCVAMTPLMLQVCQRLKRPPLPYLIALATASNVGSVAAITGNPQNIMIGSLSGIGYLRFAERLAPIAAIGLLLNFAVVAVVYRRELSSPVSSATVPTSPRGVIHRGLLLKSIAVTLITIGCFFSGLPIAIVALAAAGFCLLNRIRPAKIYRLVDWTLLLMFMGLFIIVRAFELHIVRGLGLEQLVSDVPSPVLAISGPSLILSNLVSNVPAVLLFEPLMGSMPDQEQSWLALSMSSTLAGNLTLLGSVANLIVVETARKSGIEVSFWEYLKAGVVLTIATIAVGISWLTFTNY